MPKRNMRWADDSSSDEEDTFLPPNSMTSNQLNDGFVSAEATNQITRSTGLNWGDSSSEEEEEIEVEDEVWSSSSSSEEESSEDDEPTATPPAQVAQVIAKPIPEPKKPLTKKEKQVLKAKDMDDLDALLNEFGVSEDTPATNEVEDDVVKKT